MKEQWHNDDGAFLLFGKEVNKIIAALQYLSNKNQNVPGLNNFIRKLKNMRSYDDMLDEMIYENSGIPYRKDPLMTEDEELRDAKTLEEILSRLNLKLPKKKK